MDSPLEIGIDIGGTFTDVVAYTSDHQVLLLKVPTSSRAPAEAVRTAVDELKRSWGIEPHRITRLLHGTTLATNAVLERKGARVGLLTTKGFRDVLEIGRGLRHAVYEAILAPATPAFLAPGTRRKEVVERIAADGAVLVPLEEDSVRRSMEALAVERVGAIAVCFLFSFLNRTHEQRTRELIEARDPDLSVSLSSEVDPAFREYERTVATCFDAYLKPVLNDYLLALEGFLSDLGLSIPLQIMQARGGVTTSEIARGHPLRLFLSGPAAGVIGGRVMGKNAGVSDLITLDVGGTSCDIALIQGGEPVVRPEGEISGYPVRVPMIDINTIGAGGGSIAWRDEAGSLRVGPESAGADPGPACYGTGGVEPTVTDASLVLGYLHPDSFAGGALALHPECAHESIETRLAGPLGMSVEDAALGVHRILIAQMAEGVRAVSVRQGIDPRRFTLLAMGGAGPLLATALAEELDIRSVLVPRYAGVLSALGLLAARVEHESACSFLRPLQSLDLAELQGALKGLDAQCAKYMHQQRVPKTAVRIAYSADMCYVGQSYYIEVQLRPEAHAPLARLREEFLLRHESVYGHSADAPIQVVNLRSVHHAFGRDTLEIRPAGEGPSATRAPRVRREARLRGSSRREMVDVYDRGALEGVAAGQITGPAIVEQVDTTTLIAPGWDARMIDDGSMLMRRRA